MNSYPTCRVFCSSYYRLKHNSLYGNMYKATPSSIEESDPQRVDVKKLAQQIQEVKKSSFDAISNISFGPNISSVDVLRDFYFYPDKVVARKECMAPFSVAQLTSNGDWVVITRCFHAVFGNIYSICFQKKG